MEQKDIDRLVAISRKITENQRVAKEANAVLEDEAETVRRRCDHNNPDGTPSLELIEPTETTWPCDTVTICTLCGQVLTVPD